MQQRVVSSMTTSTTTTTAPGNTCAVEIVSDLKQVHLKRRSPSSFSWAASSPVPRWRRPYQWLGTLLAVATICFCVLNYVQLLLWFPRLDDTFPSLHRMQLQSHWKHALMASHTKAQPFALLHLTREELRQRQRPRWTPEQQQVAAMARHAWKGYRQFAFPRDTLQLQFGHQLGATSMFDGHDMAYTLVDSLDTLWLLGMFEEFDDASAWARNHLADQMLKPTQNVSVNAFETTIRSLGGLLSAYFLSGQAHLLDLAHALGSALVDNFICDGAFPCQFTTLDSSSPMPEELLDVKLAGNLAEVGSFQLEFMLLSNLTGDSRFRQLVTLINDFFSDAMANHHRDGLFPVKMNWQIGRGQPFSAVSFGAQADSYYEYLLKQALQSPWTEDAPKLAHKYWQAIDSMMQQLIGKSDQSDQLFVGKRLEGRFIPRMEHLTCFLPGTLVLGYELAGMPVSHLELAQDLMETCVNMYRHNPKGLAAEVTQFTGHHFDYKAHGRQRHRQLQKRFRPQQQNQSWLLAPEQVDDMFVLPNDDLYLLRPETIESLWLLSRFTKDQRYREYGKQIMKSLEQHCRVDQGGYFTSLGVTERLATPRFRPRDMESFFMAETIKYLFLLFEDDGDDAELLLPLDQVVFSTEAHVFPVLRWK